MYKLLYTHASTNKNTGTREGVLFFFNDFLVVLGTAVPTTLRVEWLQVVVTRNIFPSYTSTRTSYNHTKGSFFFRNTDACSVLYR